MGRVGEGRAQFGGAEKKILETPQNPQITVRLYIFAMTNPAPQHTRTRNRSRTPESDYSDSWKLCATRGARAKRKTTETFWRAARSENFIHFPTHLRRHRIHECAMVNPRATKDAYIHAR